MAGLSGENTNNFDSNYFLQEGTIKSCAISYRQPKKSKPEESDDITLELVFSIKKKDNTLYDKKVNITGNYKRDENSRVVIGWSTAFKIKDFFNKLGLNDWSTDDMGVFPESLCKQVIGKSLWILSYRTDNIQDNNRQYLTYKMFGKTAKEVEERFIKDTKGDFFPYMYTPKPTEGDTDFNPNDFKKDNSQPYEDVI